LRILLAMLLAPCAAQLVSPELGIPPEIQKLICGFAKSKSIEDSTVEDICNEVEKLFPTIKFDPDCKTVMEELWDTGLALFCPESSNEVAVSDPIPPGIEKLICQFASDKKVEDNAAGFICDKVQELFPSIHFDPDCNTVVEELWDTGLALFCQQSNLNEELPKPNDIEKLICEVASSKDIEDRAVDAVCEKIQQLFPKAKFDPDCKTVLDEAWDAAAAMCPKPQESDIEKLICKVASSKDIEDRAVDGVCEKIHMLFPKAKFDPDCKTALDDAWDAAVSMCPKPQEQIIV